jgi:hypothetical protein
MMEEEWLTGNDPRSMLDRLRTTASQRKLRLFAAASFSRLIQLLPERCQRDGISLLERMAEEAIPLNVIRRVMTEVRRTIPRMDHLDDPALAALMLYREFASSRVAEHAISAVEGLSHERAARRDEQGLLVLDVFANPFRAIAFDPRWRTADTVGLARAIYDDRAFDRLPLLADALMDAGCADEQVLGHCRGDGPHVRGCWVVDLVLGKE